MKKVVIICARNEEETVAEVVRAARSARAGEVVVVDDGSTDRTARRAREAGARVVAGPGEGKGQAMLRGLEEAGDFDVDADLCGLLPQHVIRLARLSERFEHVVQLRDYGLPPVVARILPRISGERAVRASILRSVPRRWWRGFLIETGINRVAASLLSTETSYVAAGVTHRLKARKRGVVKGLLGDLDMFASIAAAHVTPVRVIGDEYPRIGRLPVAPAVPKTERACAEAAS